MKITSVKAYILRCALKEPFSYSQRWFDKRGTLLVEITTDDGLSGWGECFCHDGAPAVKVILEKVYQPHLIGRDPMERTVIWDELYNWTRDFGQKGLTTAALSGLDIALWDLAGQIANVPVYGLLGGPFRTSVPAYATGLYGTKASLDDLGVLVAEAADYVKRGFQAVKMKVGYGIKRDIVQVRAVREAIGDEIGLMVDANHAYDAASAIKLGRAIEPLDIGWFEEPVVPEDRLGYREVRSALDIPIAGGEAEFTRYGFRDLIIGGGVDIVQPDLCITGGISEGLKILALAQAFGVTCIPHVWGSGIALTASLHFLAALPNQPPSLWQNDPMLEFDRTENPIRERILTEPVTLVAGRVHVPTGAGLGITVDRDVIQEYRVD